MSRSGPTKEAYDSLKSKLAAMEAELCHARKLLEAPKKVGGWKRFWGRSGYLAAALVIVCVMGAGTWGQGSPGFVDGSKYLQLNEFAQNAYIAGAADVFCFLANANNPEKMAQLFDKCTDGKSARQIHAIVDKHLKEHPENWHYSMASTVFVAVKNTCSR